jgi:DNA-directed RNA polymerase subunit H
MKKNEYSVLDHVLVPKHIVMTEEEVEELLRKFAITKDDLPLIKMNDAVIEEIGAKMGDVVKIMRKKSPAGEAVSYRLVVK